MSKKNWKEEEIRMGSGEEKENNGGRREKRMDSWRRKERRRIIDFFNLSLGVFWGFQIFNILLKIKD